MKMKMNMKMKMVFSVASIILISMADSRACNFPAIYNFGDSNSDTGGISAAFYPTILPCGQTFFHKTAGRGCDGRLIIDFIAKQLELPYLSAYLNSIGTNFRHGANFATGGSTIRRQNESVFENGISPFSLDIQVVQFRQFKNRTIDRYVEAIDDSIRSTLPVPEEFSKALFTIDIGQNDLSAGFRKMTNDQFRKAIPDIINEFATAVEDLYKEGARAFWVHNTGPIGCIPVAIRSVSNPKEGDLDRNGCVKEQNDAALEFNRQLKERVVKLRANLLDASLVYVDVYAAKIKLIANAKEEEITCRAKMEFTATALSAFLVFHVFVALAAPDCNFPVIFNFGDSNSDTGAISAAFEPIRWPYGDVFFNKPSGRDSDGRLIIDFIAEKLRLPYLSAYLNSLGANFRHGANFATGGSTVRKPNETIYEYGISPFFLDMQVTQFEQFKARSNDLYNQAKNPYDREKLTRPEDYSKALYTFDIGQNDLAVGFRKLSIDQLRAALPDIANQFASAIQRIYKLGGRSFWIHNTGPFGCLPVNQFYNLNPPPGILDEHGCIKAQNDISMELNNQLKAKLDKLRAELPDAAITYVDVYAAKYALISNGKTQGFPEPLKVCCGYHVRYDHVWCGTKAPINGSLVFGDACENRAQYVSWDGVHYSEAANHFVASHILSGSLSSPPIPITQACHRN